VLDELVLTEVLTVIRGDDNQRVLVEAELLEAPEQAPQLRV